MASLVYVDDIIVSGNDTKKIEKLKQYLHRTFQIKDLRKLKYFLGLEILPGPHQASFSHKESMS